MVTQQRYGVPRESPERKCYVQGECWGYRCSQEKLDRCVAGYCEAGMEDQRGEALWGKNQSPGFQSSSPALPRGLSAPRQHTYLPTHISLAGLLNNEGASEGKRVWTDS